MRSVTGLAHASQFLCDFHTRETRSFGLSDCDIRAATFARLGREALDDARRVLREFDRKSESPVIEKIIKLREALNNVRNHENAIHAVYGKFQFKSRLGKAVDKADDCIQKIPAGSVSQELINIKCTAERRFWNADTASQVVAAVEFIEAKLPDFENGEINHFDLVTKFKELSLMQKEDKQPERKISTAQPHLKKAKRVPINRDEEEDDRLRRFEDIKRVEKAIMAPAPVKIPKSGNHKPIKARIVRIELEKIIWWFRFSRNVLAISGLTVIYLNTRVTWDADQIVQFVMRFASMALGGLAARLYLKYREMQKFQ